MPDLDALAYGSAPVLVAARHFAGEREKFIARRRARDRVGLAASPDGQVSVFTAPNLITLSGYASGIAWAAGAHPALACWSVIADEFDGVSARNLGLSSKVGDRLDWGVDACMLALVGAKLGLGWVSLPITLLVQVLLKERGIAPPFGSTRAALIGYALL